MASGLYSILARARSRPSARIRAWSKASSIGVGSPAAGGAAGSVGPVGGPEVEVGDGVPGGVGRVAAGLRIGQVGGEGEVGDRDHVHPRVAVGYAVAAELFEVDPAEGGLGADRAGQAGLLRELAGGGVVEALLAGPQEAAGQGPAPLVGREGALDEQDVETALAQGQGDHVHGDGDRGVGARVVGGEPLLLGGVHAVRSSPPPGPQ